MRFTITIVFTLFASGFVLAGGPVNVQNGPLDQTSLHIAKISRDAPVHVYLFDTSNVKLGKAKHQDTARLMARTGLGWGNSAAELENSTESIGDSIVKLLAGWADGSYVKK